jgi:hypothetical protein
MTIVADPVPANPAKVLTFTTNIVGIADTWNVSYRVNGVIKLNVNLPGTTLTHTANLSVVNGDVVCVRVVGYNAGGSSATVEECVTAVVPELPPVPKAPVVTLTA